MDAISFGIKLESDVVALLESCGMTPDDVLEDVASLQERTAKSLLDLCLNGVDDKNTARLWHAYVEAIENAKA